MSTASNPPVDTHIFAQGNSIIEVSTVGFQKHGNYVNVGQPKNTLRVNDWCRDDHEIRNGIYANEPGTAAQLASALQAYYEWMPIRDPVACIAAGSSPE